MPTHAGALDRTEREKQSLVELFGELADRWKADTAPFSASWQIAAHPAYQQIADLGDDVIPLLLGRLAQPCVQWMMALCAVTGEDPSTTAHSGNIARMADDWLIWGRQRGFLHD